MRSLKNVISSAESVEALKFEVDIIYVRDNIQQVETQYGLMWEYDEIQYDYNEWIKASSVRINRLEQDNEQLIKTTQEQDNLLIENAYKIAEIQLSGGM